MACCTWEQRGCLHPSHRPKRCVTTRTNIGDPQRSRAPTLPCDCQWYQLALDRLAGVVGSTSERSNTSDAMEAGENINLQSAIALTSEPDRMRCDGHTALAQTIAVLSTMNGAASTKSVYQPPTRRKTRSARGSRKILERRGLGLMDRVLVRACGTRNFTLVVQEHVHD